MQERLPGTDLSIRDHPVTFKIDTGADVTVISEHLLYIETSLRDGAWQSTQKNH